MNELDKLQSRLNFAVEWAKRLKRELFVKNQQIETLEHEVAVLRLQNGRMIALIKERLFDKADYKDGIMTIEPTENKPTITISYDQV